MTTSMTGRDLSLSNEFPRNTYYLRLFEELDSGQEIGSDYNFPDPEKMIVYWDKVLDNPRALEVWLIYVTPDNHYESVILWKRVPDEI